MSNNTDTAMVDAFLSSKKDFIEKRTTDLIKALISFELEKKEIDAQIKIIKEEAKNDGVDVTKVSKVFNRIKTRLRAKESDLTEEDILEEMILGDIELINEIRILISPISIQ